MWDYYLFVELIIVVDIVNEPYKLLDQFKHSHVFLRHVYITCFFPNETSWYPVFQSVIFLGIVLTYERK